MLKKIILLLLAISFTISCKKIPSPTKDHIVTFKELKSQFRTPPSRYRSAPLWVWNDDMTENQIEEQLTDFKDKGIGGVFVHPRPGLITPYLSDQWHELFRHTVNFAKGLDMYVWIYDENSYPSGFAGGHVPAEMPESRNQGQGLKLTRMEKFPSELEKDYYLILKKEGEKYIDITNNFQEESVKPGDFYLFELTFYRKSPWFGGYSYVDLLYEGVTEKFIDITMAGYEKSSLNEFGKTVPGIFTDEPNISSPGGIRWTPDLFSKFLERWGYDLKTCLPSLWYEDGDWKRVRHNYYALLLELFIERWSKPWYEYCKRNNLKWTGHYWEHGWPKPNHGGDNMAMYAWHQVPAIDILMNQYKEKVNAQFGNVRAVKELISAANQMGRTRTLSETYGAGGWDLRFEDMKRIADWQYVLGVNFLNQHLSYVTIKGARKRDHPQSFSYHEPWWKHYRTLGDYCARMSLALSSGEQLYNILVLEPTTTAWMYYSQQQSNKKFNDLGQDFQDFVFELEKYQIEYDLGSENIIQHFGKVEDGKFIVGERNYNLVVLPPTFENFDKFTAGLLEQYIQQGGTVLSFNQIPLYIDGNKTDKINTLAGQFPKQWINAKSLKEKVALDKLISENFRVPEPEKIKGKLFHHRRKLNDGEILLLTNTSMEEWSTGTLRTKGKSVVELKPLNGEVIPYPAETKNGQIEIHFYLPPVGELLLFVSNSGKEDTQKKNIVPKAKFIDPTDNLKINRTSPNMLILDYCDVKIDNGSEEKDIYFFKAADKIFRHYGLNGNPWSRAVQYKTDILDKDTFPENAGFEATFFLHIDKNTDRAGLKAVIERPECWSLLINGEIIEPNQGKFWLDKAFGVYNIGKFIHTGENRLSLIATKMTIYSELEPIYILGDFGLESLEKGWKLVSPKPLQTGPWKKQGLPLYAYGVSYTKNYNLASIDNHMIVHLPPSGSGQAGWRGSVAEVSVNGQPAGIIAWPPYELDITSQIKKGENEITVTVYGTLKNLLGPFHNEPQRGTAWPSQFESAPLHQPPGNNYDVIEYGLSEDFVLLEYTVN